MLTRVLQEIANAKEPISLTALCNKLGVERGALEGMLAHLARKGKLRDDDAEHAATCNTGGVASCSCGSTCTGANTCSCAAKMPKSYSMPLVSPAAQNSHDNGA